MERLPRRLRIAMMATTLITVFVFEPIPSSTAVPAAPQRASPLKDALREPAPLEWPASPAPSRVVTAQDLKAVIEDKPRRFDLFGEKIDADSRRRRLADLPYGSLIARVSERHGVDGLLVAAVVEVESGFDATAVSRRGAVGLMQIMPVAQRIYGNKDLKDPQANLEIGSRFLRSLLKDYDGDLRLTLAAYNAGPAKVARFGGVPPYPETRAFVRKVLRVYRTHHEKVAAASPQLPWDTALALRQDGLVSPVERFALRGTNLPGTAAKE